MSRKATDWAWSLSIKPASLKLLLLSMADRADEHHRCYPSISRLVIDTGLNNKTVQKGINDLISLGVISDTGDRVGPTRRVRVLQLLIAENNPEIGVINNNKTTPKAGELNATDNGNVTNNGNITNNGTLNDPNNGTLNDPNIGVQNRSLEPVIESTTTTGSVGGVFSRTKTGPYIPAPEFNDDWQPEQTTIQRILMLNIPEEFIRDCIPEFVGFWLTANKKPFGGNYETSFFKSTQRAWVKHQNTKNQRGNGNGSNQQFNSGPDQREALESTDWLKDFGKNPFSDSADSGGCETGELVDYSDNPDFSEVAGTIPLSGRN